MTQLEVLRSKDGKYIGTTCHNRNLPLYNAIGEYIALFVKDPVEVASFGCSIGKETDGLAEQLDAITQDWYIAAVDPCEEFLPKGARDNVAFLCNTVQNYSPICIKQVVTALNMMLYVPEAEHASVIAKIATYNTHLLAITDVAEEHMYNAGYIKYLPHSEEIKQGWLHVPEKTHSMHVLWEKLKRG